MKRPPTIWLTQALVTGSTRLALFVARTYHFLFEVHHLGQGENHHRLVTELDILENVQFGIVSILSTAALFKALL